MIKLNRCAKPTFLSSEKVFELTQEFKDNSTTVWNNENIKTPLLNSSYKKCAYCECRLDEESKYMEVEHFEDKKNNPDQVVEWDNLLPSCKRCNGSKSTHDVIAEPIVNPYIDEPKEHFKLRPYRFKKKTDKGQQSIYVCDLNNSERLVRVRFDIGNKLEMTIDIADDKYYSYIEDKTTRRKNKFINIIKDLLRECQPTSIYSATTSTILHTNSTFNTLVQKLKDESLWDDEHEQLYNISINLIFDYT